MDIDIRTCARRQIGIARNMVSMQMGLNDVRDLEPAALCHIDILLNLAVRVDHRCHAPCLTSHHIGGAPQPLDKKLLCKHGSTPYI
jgi:hypothetical protein